MPVQHHTAKFERNAIHQRKLRRLFVRGVFGRVEGRAQTRIIKILNFIKVTPNPLDRVPATIKTGQECLSHNGQPLKFTLLDFWKWSVSDILSNATRGRLAEFIVAMAVNIDITQVRDEWGAFDLITPNGIKLEIKSAAYLQSWFQRALSTISFSTKLARHWDS